MLKSSTTQRNGEIDILRFVFCMLIVLFHLRLGTDISIGVQGNLGVDFFFILSGFLMAKSAFKKQQNLLPNEIPSAVASFLKTKIKRFLKYFIALFILCYTIYALIDQWDIHTTIKYFINGIPWFLLLEMFGLTSGVPGAIYITWYLSAMLIALVVSLPFLLYKYDLMQKIIFPIISFVIFGYWYKKNLHLNRLDFVGITCFGTLKAIAEIALGSFCYEITRSLSKINFSKFSKIMLTLIKVCFFTAFIIYCLLGYHIKHLNMLFLLSFAIILSFSNTTYKISQSKVTDWFSKISLPIYLFHQIIRKVLFSIGEKPTCLLTFVVDAILTIILSIALMYLIDKICSQMKKSNIAKYFIEN